jgi:hypothetical protein
MKFSVMITLLFSSGLRGLSPEHGDRMFLRKVYICLRINMASQPGTTISSSSSPWEPQIWRSSVSIVSDYRLEYRATGVRSPAEANYFSSSLCVQTNSEALSASCTMGTGVLSPGKARPERDAHLSRHLVPRSRLSRSYIFPAPWR